MIHVASSRRSTCPFRSRRRSYPVHLRVLKLEAEVVALDEVPSQEHLGEEGLSKRFGLEKKENHWLHPGDNMNVFKWNTADRLTHAINAEKLSLLRPTLGGSLISALCRKYSASVNNVFYIHICSVCRFKYFPPV